MTHPIWDPWVCRLGFHRAAALSTRSHQSPLQTWCSRGNSSFLRFLSPFATLLQRFPSLLTTVPFCSHLLSSPAVTETLVALVASIDSQAGQASCRNNGGGLTSFSTHGEATFYPSVTTECIHLRRRKTFLRFCSKLKMAKWWTECCWRKLLTFNTSGHLWLGRSAVIFGLGTKGTKGSSAIMIMPDATDAMFKVSLRTRAFNVCTASFRLSLLCSLRWALLGSLICAESERLCGRRSVLCKVLH